MNKKIAILFALMLVSTLFAAKGMTAVSSMLYGFCKDAKNVMLIGVMLMIILAAVTYALGQMMGAETRARATVWATAMLTGAIFAMLIYILAPWALQILNNGTAIGC